MQEKSYPGCNRIIIQNTRNFETIGYLNKKRTGFNYSEREGQDWNFDIDNINGLFKKIKPDRNIHQKRINRPIDIKKKTKKYLIILTIILSAIVLVREGILLYFFIIKKNDEKDEKFIRKKN